MYSLPSSSHRREPRPRLKNTGVPPTEPKARTGELTPPGIRERDCSKSCWLREVISRLSGGTVIVWVNEVDAAFQGFHPIDEALDHGLADEGAVVLRHDGFYIKPAYHAGPWAAGLVRGYVAAGLDQRAVAVSGDQQPA